MDLTRKYQQWPPLVHVVKRLQYKPNPTNLQYHLEYTPNAQSYDLGKHKELIPASGIFPDEFEEKYYKLAGGAHAREIVRAISHD